MNSANSLKEQRKNSVSDRMDDGCSIDLHKFLNKKARQNKIDVPYLFRGMTLGELKQSVTREKENLMFRNDYSLCGEGTSFTKDYETADSFMDLKSYVSSKRLKDSIDTVPLTIEIPSGSIKEFRPVDMSKLSDKELAEHPEIIDHIFALSINSDMNNAMDIEDIEYILLKKGISYLDKLERIAPQKEIEEARQFYKDLVKKKDNYKERCVVEKKDFDREYSCDNYYINNAIGEVSSEWIASNGKIPSLISYIKAVDVKDIEKEVFTLDETKIPLKRVVRVCVPQMEKDKEPEISKPFSIKDVKKDLEKISPLLSNRVVDKWQCIEDYLRYNNNVLYG